MNKEWNIFWGRMNIFHFSKFLFDFLIFLKIDPFFCGGYLAAIAAVLSAINYWRKFVATSEEKVFKTQFVSCNEHNLSLPLLVHI